MANYNLTQTGDEVQAYIDSIPVIDVTGTLNGSAITFGSNPYSQISANYAASCSSIVRLTVGTAVYLLRVTQYDGTNYTAAEMSGAHNVVATIGSSSASATIDAGIDTTPTQGSDNLVKSGGVAGELYGAIVEKEISWSNGYINTSGTIAAASTIQFSQPITLRKGERIVVETSGLVRTIIGWTTATSVAVGSVLTPIVKSTSTAHASFSYTADEDIKIVISVLKSDFAVTFYGADGLQQANNKIKTDLKFIHGGVIDLSQYPVRDGSVNTSGKWYVASGYQYILIPIDSPFVGSFHNTTATTQIAFLKSYTPPKNNDLLDLSTEIGVVSIATNSTYNFQTPSDAKFIAVNVKLGNGDRVVTLTIDGYDYLVTDVVPEVTEMLTSKVSAVVNVVAGTQKVQDINETFVAGTTIRLSVTGDSGILVTDKKAYFNDVTNGKYFPTVAYNSSITVRLTQTTSKIRIILGATTILQSGSVNFNIETLGAMDRLDYDEGMIDTLRTDVDALQGEMDADLILPSYYYDNSYIQNKVARITELGKACAVNGDCFIFITDEHWLQNAKVSPAIIKYITKNTFVRKVISGGDTADGGSEQFCNWTLAASGKQGSVHHVVGNHEYDGGGTDAKLYYLMDFINNDEVGAPQTHWYYIDNVQQKTRYIILNSEGANAFSAAQLSWFTGTALLVESGWKIIIFAHHFAGIDWTTNVASIGNNNGFTAAIQNYSGNGEIVAIVQGHFHRDRVVYLGTIPIIMTACDKYVKSAYQSTYDIDVNRDKGTITEQALDVFFFNYTTRTINILRIGGNARDGVGNDAGNEVQEREVTY